MERPSWCKIGAIFMWTCPRLTGLDEAVMEEIIGYTNDGFLHTSHHCPVYSTKFNDLNNGIFVKAG